MPREYPPITPVVVRGAGASHQGPVRMHNEDAFDFVREEHAAIAIAADGMGGSSSGREAADLAVDTLRNMFNGRVGAQIDDLAAAWWKGEHDVETDEDDVGNATVKKRVQPYEALPISDRATLRKQIEALLDKRVPHSLGDVAALEAERALLFDLPKRAVDRTNLEIMRRSENDNSWRGRGTTVVSGIFIDGHASLAHVGDSRIWRIRRGIMKQLTVEHSLANEFRKHKPDATEAEVAEVRQNHPNVITRIVGYKDPIEVDTSLVELEKGDVFVFCTDGLWRSVRSEEVVASVRSHGVEAAKKLVSMLEHEDPRRPDQTRDNIAVVIVEIVSV